MEVDGVDWIYQLGASGKWTSWTKHVVSFEYFEGDTGDNVGDSRARVNWV